MKKLMCGLMLTAALSTQAAAKGKTLFDEGDWSAYRGDNTVSLITSTGDVGLLTACRNDADTCNWAMVVQPDFCVEGTQFPALFYGHAGGLATVLTCHANDEDGTILVFNQFEAITSAVANSKTVQVAVPVADRIDVIEFNVKGYQLAVVKLDRLMKATKR